MTVATLQSHPLAPTTRFVPLTVEQYEQMIEGGILYSGEPIELIDGLLIPKDRSKAGEDPMSTGDEHAFVIDEVAELNPQMPPGCYLRTQQPIRLPPHSEPEPDGSIVRGKSTDYRRRKPGPQDILVVIEVSDSSLQFDRTTKLRLYANHAIAQYVIVSLIERTIESYRDPIAGEGRYATRAVFKVGQSFTLFLLDGRMLAVAIDRLIVD